MYGIKVERIKVAWKKSIHKKKVGVKSSLSNDPFQIQKQFTYQY